MLARSRTAPMKPSRSGIVPSRVSSDNPACRHTRHHNTALNATLHHGQVTTTHVPVKRGQRGSMRLAGCLLGHGAVVDHRG